MITKSQLTWVTGFYEGEGCAGFSSKSRVPRLFVYIAQKDIVPLQFIQKLFGFGNISKKKHVGVHYLNFSSHQARVFLNTIKPYVISLYKQKQLKRALAFDKKYIDTIYGSQLANSMLSLKQVKQIRHANKSVKWLSSIYRISERIIQRIKRSDTWKKV